MKNIVLSVVVGFLASSCHITVKKEVLQEPIVKPESIEKEPTIPEETEVWGVKPAGVIPGNDKAAPSDAIVLFDGTHFDEWVSSNEASD